MLFIEILMLWFSECRTGGAGLETGNRCYRALERPLCGVHLSHVTVEVVRSENANKNEIHVFLLTV